MIAIDSSALVAITLDEPDAAIYFSRLRSIPGAIISTVSVVEARMVVHNRTGYRGIVLLDNLLSLPGMEIVAPGLVEMEAAWNAFIAYGKGSGHPAGLNFGDVFAYATAKVRKLPLLFKGNDFSQTDIVSALS